MKELRANIRLFADDTSLFVIVEDPITAANLLSNDLTKISSWAGKWLVKFNSIKTISFILTGRKNKHRHPSLFMNNIEIKEVKWHKHLGLTFSDDGTFTSAAWKRIGILRRNKFVWDKLSLSKLYLTHIRPHLEYANIIWDNCSVENKRTFDKTQTEAAWITTGATKLCSNQNIYNETGWNTLQARRNNRKLCQLYKIISGLTPQYLRNILPLRAQELERPLCTCGAVEDSAHYLLACPNYRTNCQCYLFTLPHAPTLPLLLNGNPALPDEVNDQIFSQVQLVILSSKRFKNVER